ncbi:MAG: winged helix-turn-helix transcriptional regulator, partial [Chloroflexota bacterium]
MKSATSKEKISTRDVILETLKASPSAKIEDLAVAADISPISVRHHIKHLEADGLIVVQKVRRKVGRPYYTYSLSDAGQELFPQKYYSLTNRLINSIKDQLSPEMVHVLFAGLVDQTIEEHREKFEGLPFEERLDYLMMLLKKEGFLAKWEKTEDGYQITEYSCPYISVGQKHAEICAIDKELMISVLNTPVKQLTCMLNGEGCCKFS